MVQIEVAVVWSMAVGMVSVIFALGGAWVRLGRLERDLLAHMHREEEHTKKEDTRWETMQRWMHSIEQEVGILKGRIAHD